MMSAQRSKVEPPAGKKAISWARLLPWLLVIAGLVAWFNSLGAAFVFDDRSSILDNVRIRQLWPVTHILGGSTRPVAELTFAINYALGRLQPFGYHLFNVVVHLLAALTLFGIVRRTLLLPRFEGRFDTRAAWLAFAVALPWTVHPLCSSAVTYVVQRMESLMGLFYLLTLYCVIRAAGPTRRAWWAAAAIGACVLGMGTKEVMVTAPLVILLYDRTFLSRSLLDALRQRWQVYLGLAASWSVLVMCGAISGVVGGGGRSAGFAVETVTWWHYALSQPGVVGHYLWQSFWPRTLCIDWGWPAVSDTAGVVLPMLAVGPLVAASAWGWWRNTWYGFTGAWFFLILAPTSSVMSIRDLAFEHRMYLSLAAVACVVVIGFDWLLDRAAKRGGWLSSNGRPLAMVLLVIVSALLAWRTVLRNADYRTPVALWQSALQVRPDNLRVLNNLGNALTADGRPDEAIGYYHRALRIDPNDAEVHNNLGGALGDAGRVRQAISGYRRALQINPNFVEAHVNLGGALYALGESDQAIEHYRQALRIDRDDAKANSNMGAALAARGELHAAVEHLRRAVRAAPGFAGAHNNLGSALQILGQTDEAIEHFHQALRADPDNAKAHNNLGNVLLSQGKADAAIEHYRQSLQLSPNLPEAHYNLGLALMAEGSQSTAIQHFRRALRLNPEYDSARRELARAEAMLDAAGAK